MVKPTPSLVAKLPPLVAIIAYLTALRAIIRRALLLSLNRLQTASSCRAPARSRTPAEASKRIMKAKIS